MIHGVKKAQNQLINLKNTSEYELAKVQEQFRQLSHPKSSQLIPALRQRRKTGW